MSNVRVTSCTMREVEPRLINIDIAYEATFTETEVRLDLGFIPVVYVTPALEFTKATAWSSIPRTDNSRADYRKEAALPLRSLRPAGQSKVARTDTIQVAKDSLFADLTQAQQDHEALCVQLFTEPLWTKANAWDRAKAAVDLRIELAPDLGASQTTTANQPFANRPASALVTSRSTGVGGTGGDEFATALPADVVQLSSISVQSSGAVNQLKLTWKLRGSLGSISSATIGRGGGGKTITGFGLSTYQPGPYDGTWSDFALADGEYICELRGQAGTSLNQLQFVTSTGRTSPVYGTSTGTPFALTKLNVIGLWGRAGLGIEQLGALNVGAGSSNPVSAAAAPKPATALEFNGTDTYIEVNTPLPFTTQVTIETWMRGQPKEAFLFYFTDDAHRRQFSAHVPYADGNVYCDSGADANNNYDRVIKSVTPIDDKSTWNHWAFVRDSAAGRIAIYRNGQLWLEQASGLFRQMAACNRLVIAADGDGKWYHAGAICELRVWSVARTAAQIQDNMTRRIPAGDTGLIASYALDAYQAGAPQIVDRSGGGRHGTLRGSTTVVAGPGALVK